MDLGYLDGMVTLSRESKSANNSMERIDWKVLNHGSPSPGLDRFFLQAESQPSNPDLAKIKISRIKKKIVKICDNMIQISEQAFGVLEEGNTRLVLNKKAEFRQSFLKKIWRYQKRFMNRTRKGLGKMFSEKDQIFQCSSFVEKYLEMCMLNLKTFFVQVYGLSTKYYANKRGQAPEGQIDETTQSKSNHENRFLRKTKRCWKESMNRKFSSKNEKEFSASHSKSSITSESKSPKSFKNKMEICLESVISKLDKKREFVSKRGSFEDVYRRKASSNSFQMSNAWANKLDAPVNRSRIDSFDNWSPLRDIWREMGGDADGRRKKGRFLMANCGELKGVDEQMILEEQEGIMDLNASVDYLKQSQSFLAVRKPSWLENQCHDIVRINERKNSNNISKKFLKSKTKDFKDLGILNRNQDNCTSVTPGNSHHTHTISNHHQNQQNPMKTQSHRSKGKMIPKNTGRKWKTEEDEYVLKLLQSTYPKKPTSENIKNLANDLGRSESSIKYRIRILKKKHREYFQNLAGDIMSSVVQRSQTGSIPLNSLSKTNECGSLSQSLRCETASMNLNSKTQNDSIIVADSQTVTMNNGFKSGHCKPQINVQSTFENQIPEIQIETIGNESSMQSSEKMGLIRDNELNNNDNNYYANNTALKIPLASNRNSNLRNSTSIRLNINQSSEPTTKLLEERSFPSDISLNINKQNIFDQPIISAEHFNQLNATLSKIEPIIKDEGATFEEICKYLGDVKTEQDQQHMSDQLLQLKEMCKINSRPEKYISTRHEIIIRLQREGSRFWEKGGYSAILDFVFTSFYHQNFEKMSLKVLKIKVIKQFDLLDSTIQSFDNQFIQFLFDSQFFYMVDENVFFI